jgi:UDP-2-acetamido-3-amino-2,3-dideoxy-glucuronate N-acetyltransferase
MRQIISVIMISSKMKCNIHETSIVQTTNIGEGTAIWQYAVILEGAKIGSNCNINCHTFIESDVLVGNNVTVKSGVYLWSGITIEDGVFIGPNVTFTNDLMPRSKAYPESFLKTIVKEGASIGANSTIIGGITIGQFALIGAGSVVTKSVPAYALVYGNPAKIKGWVDNRGTKMKEVDGFWISVDGEKFKVESNSLKKVITNN